MIIALPKLGVVVWPERAAGTTWSVGEAHKSGSSLLFAVCAVRLLDCPVGSMSRLEARTTRATSRSPMSLDRLLSCSAATMPP
jgi:hypothetical protein